jgi:Mrp family chromosome partitioning ATPase
MTPGRIVQLASEEEFKLIDQLFPSDAPKKRKLIFTAPDRATGCSWLIARIAMKLTKRLSGSICVVDANLHWPTLHCLFGIENRVGFLQLLLHQQPPSAVTQRVGETNLWVMPSGGLLPDSHGMFAVETLKPCIDELSREFDYLLIDTPAMRASADSSLIGRLTDGVVLVIAANSTQRDTALNAKTILEAANIPILGAVLNKRTFAIPDSIYQML